jgi:hypothetical protein
MRLRKLAPSIEPANHCAAHPCPLSCQQRRRTLSVPGAGVDVAGVNPAPMVLPTTPGLVRTACRDQPCSVSTRPPASANGHQCSRRPSTPIDTHRRSPDPHSENTTAQSFPPQRRQCATRRDATGSLSVASEAAAERRPTSLESEVASAGAGRGYSRVLTRRR